MEKRRAGGQAWLLWVGILFIVSGVLVFAWEDAPQEAIDMAVQPDHVAMGCVQQQTLHYVYCGHEVLRRIDVPAEWLGMDRAQVAATLNEDTRITGFASGRIDILCRMELFCPQHAVLMINGEGRVCYFENRYGDAMLEGDATAWMAKDLPMIEQDNLRQGIAFDTRDEAEQYMTGWADG